jgi:hypothetical protein
LGAERFAAAHHFTHMARKEVSGKKQIYSNPYLTGE